MGSIQLVLSTVAFFSPSANVDSLPNIAGDPLIGGRTMDLCCRGVYHWMRASLERGTLVILAKKAFEEPLASPGKSCVGVLSWLLLLLASRSNVAIHRLRRHRVLAGYGLDPRDLKVNDCIADDGAECVPRRDAERVDGTRPGWRGPWYHADLQ